MAFVRLAVAAVACVLLVVVAELVARRVLRRRGGYYRYVPYWSERLEFAPGSMPGGRESADVQINADGERGGPPPAPGEPCYRALVVGGSAAECYYLDQTETWSGVVERILNEPEQLAALGVPRVHVGNASRAILPVAALHVLLQKTLPRYRRLDLIVAMVGGADVISWVERGAKSDIPDGRVPLDRIFEQHPEGPWGLRPSQTALWRILGQWNRRVRRPMVVRPDANAWLHRVRKMRAEAPHRIDEVPDPAPMLASFEKNLRAFLETARAHADRVILARQPWFGPDPTPEEEAMFWNFGLGRPYKEKVETYFTPRVVDALMRAMDERAAAVAASMGIEQIDVGGLLEHSARIFYDELHFTPEGAEEVGQAVAAAVVAPERVGA